MCECGCGECVVCMYVHMEIMNKYLKGKMLTT